MRQSSESALRDRQLAGGNSSRVAKVLYPGLASHPQHQLARRQMQNGFSGIVTFFVKGGLGEAKHFLEASAGSSRSRRAWCGVESLVDHPGLMTHASIPPEKRR